MFEIEAGSMTREMSELQNIQRMTSICDDPAARNRRPSPGQAHMIAFDSRVSHRRLPGPVPTIWILGEERWLALLAAANVDMHELDRRAEIFAAAQAFRPLMVSAKYSFIAILWMFDK